MIPRPGESGLAGNDVAVCGEDSQQVLPGRSVRAGLGQRWQRVKQRRLNQVVLAGPAAIQRGFARAGPRRDTFHGQSAVTDSSQFGQRRVVERVLELFASAAGADRRGLLCHA